MDAHALKELQDWTEYWRHRAEKRAAEAHELVGRLAAENLRLRAEIARDAE